MAFAEAASVRSVAAARSLVPFETEGPIFSWAAGTTGAIRGAERIALTGRQKISSPRYDRKYAVVPPPLLSIIRGSSLAEEEEEEEPDRRILSPPCTLPSVLCTWFCARGVRIRRGRYGRQVQQADELNGDRFLSRRAFDRSITRLRDASALATTRFFRASPCARRFLPAGAGELLLSTTAIYRRRVGETEKIKMARLTR